MLTLSRETVTDWKWLFHDTCFQWLETNSQRGGQIGGLGEVAEIDEAVCKKEVPQGSVRRWAMGPRHGATVGVASRDAAPRWLGTPQSLSI